MAAAPMSGRTPLMPDNAMGPCPNCGHELAEHTESDRGANTVCCEKLPTFPEGGFHGVCPCVLPDDVEAYADAS